MNLSEYKNTSSSDLTKECYSFQIVFSYLPGMNPSLSFTLSLSSHSHLLSRLQSRHRSLLWSLCQFSFDLAITSRRSLLWSHHHIPPTHSQTPLSTSFFICILGIPYRLWPHQMHLTKPPLANCISLPPPMSPQISASLLSPSRCRSLSRWLCVCVCVCVFGWYWLWCFFGLFFQLL